MEKGSSTSANYNNFVSGITTMIPITLDAKVVRHARKQTFLIEKMTDRILEKISTSQKSMIEKEKRRTDAEYRLQQLDSKHLNEVFQVIEGRINPDLKKYLSSGENKQSLIKFLGEFTLQHMKENSCLTGWTKTVPCWIISQSRNSENNKSKIKENAIKKLKSKCEEISQRIVNHLKSLTHKDIEWEYDALPDDEQDFLVLRKKAKDLILEKVYREINNWRLKNKNKVDDEIKKGSSRRIRNH
ncbi:Hypothetical predicted protein [Mytilus galloprovincialis]|uniref:Uncharacterized protein n=1 Tax=Mytilus galloprovincialis TaxID=29158 RepID=A0A8B6HT25_MYTGA|nr:Hypothetical predicted protein [Mytilus galloprovincialis]